jgi:hypothetical protein
MGERLAAQQRDAFQFRATGLGFDNSIEDVADSGLLSSLKTEHFRVAAAWATHGAALEPNRKAISRTFGLCSRHNLRELHRTIPFLFIQ